MLAADISIIAATGTWVIVADGAVLGESERAIELVEADGTEVIFFPREDVGMAFLEGSATVRPNSALGDARCFSIVTQNGVMTDVAWSYETPASGAERLAGLIAFDSRRVAVEEL
jgi:uncharacterized protein (DUF427 family)